METLTQLVQRTVSLFDAHRIDELMELYTDDVRVVFPTGGLAGRAQVAELYRAALLACPDLRCELAHAVLDGDRARVALRLRGTHLGPLVAGAAALPATGRVLSGVVAETLTFRGGKIAEVRAELDGAALDAQLGDAALTA